ncbi:alpha/beta hydrolase [Thiomicrorhabdus aquaedulcis]|uniref:alpha/beta hydrolase n=1 Tax=Thiomicrorhabdus aquaedulcis TaxID=2211106 RepID=UPI000FDA0E0A|nr:dienelactone hydrolase family protein [Thiomicrorhabdus aquaedulcis]
MNQRLNDVQDAPIIIEPKAPATAAVIWLHGLGADGYDFAGIVEQLNLPAQHGIRFVFPHAPVQAVTINGGAKMRSWYDIASTDFLKEVDAAGIEASSAQIDTLIHQQINQGILASRIVLAGFSQGGLVALHTGLHFKPTLAGVLALSTYYPMDRLVDAFTKGVTAPPTDVLSTDVPITMMHGTLDNVIGLRIAQQSCAALAAKGWKVDWHEYPMAHQVCAAQINDMAKWFSRTLTLNQAWS